MPMKPNVSKTTISSDNLFILVHRESRTFYYFTVEVKKQQIDEGKKILKQPNELNIKEKARK